MKVRTALPLLIVATIAAFAVTTAARVPPPPPKDTPVTSIVLDYAADVAPALHVRSDGLGSYLNSRTLVSIIQGIGDWELDAINPRNATRRIYLDFSQPIAGSAPGGTDPTPLLSGAYTFRAIAKCTLYGNSLLGFTAGATKNCPLHIGFDYNGVRYAFQMDPIAAANGPFPETNYAKVTCIFPTTGTAPCSQWKFTPSGSYIAGDGSVKYRNVAKLLEYDSHGAFVGEHGDFYLSFSILIAK